VCDEGGEYLLGGSLSDSEFATENELDDRCLLDVVVSYDSDEEDDIIQHFMWENMEK
jgi:hypothetical protein